MISPAVQEALVKASSLAIASHSKEFLRHHPNKCALMLYSRNRMIYVLTSSQATSTPPFRTFGPGFTDGLPNKLKYDMEHQVAATNKMCDVMVFSHLAKTADRPSTTKRKEERIF